MGWDPYDTYSYKLNSRLVISASIAEKIDNEQKVTFLLTMIVQDKN